MSPPSLTNAPESNDAVFRDRIAGLRALVAPQQHHSELARPPATAGNTSSSSRRNSESDTQHHLSESHRTSPADRTMQQLRAENAELRDTVTDLQGLLASYKGMLARSVGIIDELLESVARYEHVLVAVDVCSALFVLLLLVIYGLWFMSGK